jgi:chlorobactene glucosyltransferase
MLDFSDAFPTLAFLSLAGSLAIFAYLFATERKAPIFSYASQDGQNVKVKPMVSIIVTEKNEEHLIKSCLDSLLDQSYDNLEILVIDDSSTDGTPEIVRKLAIDFQALHLIPAGPKPPDWVGKSWPCWRGFQESKGKYLLFVDADSTFHRSVVERSVLYAEKNSLDMFSLAPRVRFHGIWAKAVLPLITGAINLLYPLQKVNDPKSKRAYVFGTYFLIRREAYRETGGHSKVRDQLVEDAAIAQLVKSAGHNLRVEEGGELIETEWESDRNAIFQGLERVTSSSIKTYGMVSILNAILLFFLIIYPVLYVVTAVATRSFSEILLAGFTASALNILLFLALTNRELKAISGKAGPEIILYFLGGIIFIIAIITTSFKVATNRDLYWKGQGYRQAKQRPGRSMESTPND